MEEMRLIGEKVKELDEKVGIIEAELDGPCHEYPKKAS